MKMNHVKVGNKPSLWKGILLSLVISLCLLVLGAISVTAMVSSGAIEETSYTGFVWLILALSALGGGISGLAVEKDKGFIAVIGGAAVFYLILICLNIVLFDGQFLGIGMGTLMVALGAGGSILLKNIPFAGRHKAKYKYHYR